MIAKKGEADASSIRVARIGKLAITADDADPPHAAHDDQNGRWQHLHPNTREAGLNHP
jgi:hypothetical protein